jgi:uncharacterized iron-regulated protein
MPAPSLRPIHALLTLVLCLCGCAISAPSELDNTVQRLERLLPADAIFLGEQHDAPDHHRVQREVAQLLAARGDLAALALEMAEHGRSTAALTADASEAQVQAALGWSEGPWPWADYGPVVMVAVRAGVPVLGANLPRAQMRARMGDATLDARLGAADFQQQQADIRAGHCDKLPESQITPMTRVQIARDLTMAQTVRAATVAGKTVLLLAGRGHVDRQLGVPRHLPADFRLRAVGIGDAETPEERERFDQVWPAQPGPKKDYCAEFKTR